MPQSEIELVVGGWDDDPAEIADAADRLCEELDLLDFDRLDRPATPSESGTRSGAAVAAGTLVGLLASPVVLRAVVDVSRAGWSGRNAGRSPSRSGTTASS